MSSYKLDNDFGRRSLQLSYQDLDALSLLQPIAEENGDGRVVSEAIARRVARDKKDAREAYYRSLGVY